MEPTPTLLLLSLPPSSLCGIDLLSFTTTPQFHGLKDLPGGLHFVFTSPHNTLSARHGAWFHVPTGPSPPPPSSSSPMQAPTLIIKRWSHTTETLEPVTDPTERLSHRANLGAVWRAGGLVPYRQSANATDTALGLEGETSWSALCRHVTGGYLRRVFGDRHGVGGAEEVVEEAWHLTSYTDGGGDGGDGLGDGDGSALAAGEREASLALLRLEARRRWREGAWGRERTEMARDWSWYLAELGRGLLLPRAGGGGGDGGGGGGGGGDGDGAGDFAWGGRGVVLAEVQFCFLMGLTLGNFACLEQWRRLVRLVLGCESGVREEPGFWVEVLDVLRAQILRLGREAGGDGEARGVDGRGAGPTMGEVATELEDKTEEELLRYDLPVRGKGRGTRRKGKGALAQAARRMERQVMEEGRREVSDGGGGVGGGADDDELRQLFLEEEVDSSGRSFLVAALVRFRESVERLASSGDGPMEVDDGAGTSTRESRAVGIRDVLDRLRRLEATLFDMYGWEFDTAPAERMARPRRSLRPGADGVDLSDGNNALAVDYDEGDDEGDDEEDDEGEEYRPTVVDLTQEQMDALGITGTPSSKADLPRRTNGLGRKDASTVSQVVVEDSSDEEPEAEGEDEEEEDLDDTLNIEELDARY